jgi:SnoaL-like domain
MTTRRRGPRPSRPIATPPETIVWRWVEAFNALDLEHMIRCLDSDVRFHPLKLAGLSSSYRGRNGVTRWFGDLVRLGHEHRIVLDELGVIADGQVLAVGSLALADEPDIEVGPFHALHRLNGGLIVAAHHCVTNPDLIEHLGLIP